MFTPTGRALAIGGGGLAVYGALFGNAPIMAAGAVPLLFSGFATMPKPPSVTRTLSAERLERGGHVDVMIEVVAPRGMGLLEIHQSLPEEFELLEGNNLHVVSLGIRPQHLKFPFRVRVPKRGDYDIASVTVRRIHPLELAATPAIPVGPRARLRVEPRPIAARLPRELRTRAKNPFPDGDVARMGIETEDFKELRQYVPGDPARRINWKATARSLAAGINTTPLVNETEREGKKKVWIIVDGHGRLSAGTNLEDAREHAADAAISVAQLYLRRHYSVGLSLARSGHIPTEFAGHGEAQVRRIRKALARLAPGDAPSLVDVLERDRTHFHRDRPLVILVTRLSGHDPDLAAGIRRIARFTQGRGLVPGLILNIDIPSPPALDLSGEAARRVVDKGGRELQDRARAAGLRVVTWRAKDEPLLSALARGRLG